jgi:hypothetical protein
MTSPELAYIDPGSGSMILQVVAGGVAAAAVAGKIFWRQLLTFLHLRKPDDEETTS